MPGSECLLGEVSSFKLALLEHALLLDLESVVETSSLLVGFTWFPCDVRTVYRPTGRYWPNGVSAL